MSEIRKTFLAIDLLRLAIGAGLFIAALQLQGGSPFRWILTLFVIYPALWILLTQLGLVDEMKHQWLVYIPCTADLAAFSFVFYITGTLNSIAILGFFVSAIMSSLNVQVRTGRYIVIVSIITVTVLSVSVHLGNLPGVNMVGGESTITTPQLILSLLVFIPSIIIVQKLVFNLTRSIRQTADELFAEKEILKARNDIMERELELARRIQRHLLPSSAPIPCIHSVYRPMHMVGGDFYDYPFLGGDGKVGIFISDVSGHGVPAALITSMIKTAITRAGGVAADPAGMLRYLNATLYARTGGNFVTAFYAIFDRSTGNLTYSNAGHNRPLVINGTNVRELECSRSLPLAITDDNFLESNGKMFRNDTATLEPGCKLLLYTDGLTEAAPADDRTRMFEEVLGQNLVELGRLPGNEFVADLYDRLVAFRGNGSFEDDVCFICVDVA